MDLLMVSADFPVEAAQNTPAAMLEYVKALQLENLALRKEIQSLNARIEKLEAKLNQNSSNSNKPPSSDSPFETKVAAPPKPKAKRKRKGVRQQCLKPTEVKELLPGRCTCGCTELLDPFPYYIHQFIELPFIQPIVQHIILFCGRCARCGKLHKAVVPHELRTGFGPRLSAMVAELCGVHGDSRRAVQDFMHSVLGLPISQGGIQKVLDRVAKAIEPHYEAIGDVAHAAPVNHLDETSWWRKGRLAWLWVMTNVKVAFFLIHDKRSTAAFLALIKDWKGILISDGYGVYRNWVGLRQACLAHLIREAKGLSERGSPEISRCGTWAHKELQRLCHMAHAPPTRGEWDMFYARLIRLISVYGDRKDDAGRLVRHLQREMENLWLFLEKEGVAPTNNHAERMLRFAVIWRKRSLGTVSEKGERWAERILSLRQTCRIQGKRTYPVLVEAMTAFFKGEHPNLAWIRALAD